MSKIHFIKYYRILLFAGMIFLLACNKKKNQQFCYWTADGKEFKTKEYSAFSGGASVISATSFTNQFSLSFDARSNFPDYGTYLLTRPSEPVSLSFRVNSKEYSVCSDTAVIHATSVDGKFQYTLYHTPFFHEESGIRDTLIFTATINEPNVIGE